MYILAADGQHSCPSCGKVQTLSAYEPKVKLTPQFYSVMAVRSGEQLEQAQQEILTVASDMDFLCEAGENMAKHVPPLRENCVHPIYGSCEFYKLDTYRISPEEDETLERRDPTRYVQLGVV